MAMQSTSQPPISSSSSSVGVLTYSQIVCDSSQRNNNNNNSKNIMKEKAASSISESTSNVDGSETCNDTTTSCSSSSTSHRHNNNNNNDRSVSPPPPSSSNAGAVTASTAAAAVASGVPAPVTFGQKRRNQNSHHNNYHYHTRNQQIQNSTTSNNESNNNKGDILHSNNKKTAGGKYKKIFNNNKFNKCNSNHNTNENNSHRFHRTNHKHSTNHHNDDIKNDGKKKTDHSHHHKHHRRTNNNNSPINNGSKNSSSSSSSKWVGNNSNSRSYNNKTYDSTSLTDQPRNYHHKHRHHRRYNSFNNNNNTNSQSYSYLKSGIKNAMYRIPPESKTESLALISHLKQREWVLEGGIGTPNGPLEMNETTTTTTAGTVADTAVVDASTTVVAGGASTNASPTSLVISRCTSPNDEPKVIVENKNQITATESQRRQCLALVEKTLCQWSSSIQAERPSNNSSKWQQPRVTLVTFGSYRLMAYQPDADLDVLALCPPTCTRDDFFTSLLKRMEDEQSITDIHAIPTAYTPVIKFKVKIDNRLTAPQIQTKDGDGYTLVQVDLLFGRLSNTSKLMQFQSQRSSPLLVNNMFIGKNGPRANGRSLEYTIDDSDLLGMDEASVRSLNGARVTQLLLELVPDVNTYRVTLSAVKDWATRNGLYSNVMGFFGGINWAILVAKVAQKFPKHPPSSLLRIFFQFYATWSWPSPVMLVDVQQEPPAGCTRMPVWDATNNVRDSRHLMPILTPVYPSMNSSYNVGIPQQRRLMEEMILAANCMGNRDANWRQIMRPTTFFSRFQHFLQITVRSINAEDFMKWFRLCESRLRILITSIDGPEVTAWPFAFWFKREASEAGVVTDSGSTASEDDCMQEAFMFIGLKFATGVESINLKHDTSEFLYNINSWDGRKDGMDFLMNTVLREDLPFDLIEQHLLQSEDETLSPASNQHAHPPMWYVNQYKEDFDLASTMSGRTTSTSSSTTTPEQTDSFDDTDYEGNLDDDNTADDNNNVHVTQNDSQVDTLGNLPASVHNDPSSSQSLLTKPSSLQKADEESGRTRITPKMARSCVGDDDLITMLPNKRPRPSIESIPTTFLDAARKAMHSDK